MYEKNRIEDAGALKKHFQTDRNACSPYIYIPIDSREELSTPEKITRLLTGYRRSGFGGVIPFTNKNYDIPALTEPYYEFYENVYRQAENNALKLGYLDDSYIMREYLDGLDDPASAVCQILSKYEYACTEKSVFKKKLHTDGTLMSVVAVNDDDLEIIDLRAFLEDGLLTWDVPEGNWNVEEYVCACDFVSNHINTMDYEVSYEYLRQTFGRMLDRLAASGDEHPIDLFIYRNVLYAGRNRRMWHPDFNKVFEKMYGFSPAPYYPLLYRDFAGASKRYKSMMMTCRSAMLTDGYLKAAADICMARDVFCTGFPAESKATACSWMFGDGQLLHRYASAPGISMPFAYLYGVNGVKVAAGAADMMGADTVSVDLFKYFLILNRDIVYRESMNAFVRGVNMVFAHLGEDRTKEHSDLVENDAASWGSIFTKGDDLADFAAYATRVQTMLRGGEHVSEAAILYPIHSLHANVYLYESDNNDFEYPSTPGNADYMELMNSFLNYVGIDSTFLHPMAVEEHSVAENGILYLNNSNYVMKFRLLVMPSMSVISLKTLRVIRKFFDEGGRIIATDSLPMASCDCSLIFDDVNRALHTVSPEDEEVRETIEYIFGSDVTDKRVYKRYYKNVSEKGGAAYFFPSNKTSVDGTDSISADILYQATQLFNLKPDVYIDKMPRGEFNGFLNTHLPEFLKIGIDKKLAKGCSMNCLHKRYAECDIYFVTNTTGNAYNGNILLRGRHNAEAWNPYTGKTHRLACETVRFRDEVYTRVEVSVEASSCIFLVSPLSRTQKDALRDLTEEEELPEYFAHENY